MKLTRPRVLVWCLVAAGLSAAAGLALGAQADAPVTWDDAAAAAYLDAR